MTIWTDPTRNKADMETEGKRWEEKGSSKVTEVNSPQSESKYESPTQYGQEDLWGDSSHDQRDMLRLGKKQEFKRNFHLLSGNRTKAIRTANTGRHVFVLTTY